ncbi:uncharacterized protein LOC141638133 [Silene latifolia]|uniref:uncharacterized protein LOC141638133 n=1 Tax=Silene latifolia TaxID=37657 RepID=UPI003D781BD9
MLDFNDCLASCHLDDLTCTGVDMTWTIKQDSVTRVWSKLDRVLANPGFITSYPNAFGHFQEPGLSDHSPVLVLISHDKKVVKRFSFLNSWVGHPDYLQTIKAAWITPLQGSPMYCFFQKKSVKHALTQFHKQHFSNISHKVQTVKNALEERLLIADYTKLKDHEFSILSQRAKIKDIQDSDCSSKYFFAKISERTHQQVIGGIHDHHGKLHMGFSSVSNAFNQYYQDLLGHSSPTAPLDTDFLSTGAVVTSPDKQSLIRDISPTEIRDALFSMDSNSSPGIDGLSAGFFKSAWQIIAKDFCKAVNQFFSSSKMSKQANSTVISLIPKKAIANAVTDYRPISCCTVFYKTTLVKGYNRANVSPRCMIKVDIRKAFDSLQWSFIAAMLSGLGIPQQFIGWGDVPSVAAIKRTLSLFAELSGLHANIEKTNIYFGGVHPDVKEAILAATGFSEGQFPFRYLGVPLSTSRVSVTLFDSLILKIKHFIQHWSSNFLTYAGGFNIKDLSTWNDALQCRWLYLLAHTTEGSWASWHQAYILQHQSIWNVQTHDSFSSSLKGIMTVRDRLVALTCSITNASSLINSWCSHGKFRVTAAYSYLRAQKKLATVDNMQHRGFYMVNRCSLCEVALDDHAHLFFNCSFSKDIWQQLMHWMGVNHAGLCLLSELENAGVGSKQNWRMAWFCTTLAAAVY